MTSTAVTMYGATSEYMDSEAEGMGAFANIPNMTTSVQSVTNLKPS